MNSKLYTKKAVLVSIGAVVVLLVGCIIINIFMIKPAVAKIELENAASDVPELKAKRTDDGFIYYLVTTDAGDTYALLSTYKGNSKNVIIPAEIEGYPLKELGETCFSSNDVIETVKIPPSVTVVGRMAFSDCDNLKKVVIPASVTEIGYQIELYSDFVIYTTENSPAMQYAQENEISYQIQ